MKADRVVKELVEAAPVIDAVRSVVAQQQLAGGEKISIIDLCSGKGFLSMFLSEMLDPDKVERCFLVDKAWPPHDLEGEIKPHHISDAHIYGERPESADVPRYYNSWPVPLHTSKQDLKNKATVRKMGKHMFARCSGPVLILGVHLCGTLSLRAVDLFNNHPQAKMLVLKPCCLPGMVHANRDEVFTIGRHSFPASDVCASGRFTARGIWKGPPRGDLKPRFERWAEHLCAGIDLSAAAKGEDVAGAKAVHYAEVQTQGGYQNLFIVGERAETTDALWARVRESEFRS